MKTLFYKGASGHILVRDEFTWANPRKSRVQRPFLLHGTSSLLVNDIMKNGLLPKIPLLNDKEIRILREIAKEVRESSSGTINIYPKVSAERLERVHLTLDANHAGKHAIEGPQILEDVIKGLQTAAGLYIQMPAEASRIVEKIRDFLSRHKPAMLFIDLGSYVPNLEKIEKLVEIFHSKKTLNEPELEPIQFMINQDRMAGLKLPEIIETIMRQYFYYNNPSIAVGFVKPSEIKRVEEIDPKFFEIGQK